MKRKFIIEPVTPSSDKHLDANQVKWALQDIFKEMFYQTPAIQAYNTTSEGQPIVHAEFKTSHEDSKYITTSVLKKKLQEALNHKDIKISRLVVGNRVHFTVTAYI